jgi:hypothetical protein
VGLTGREKGGDGYEEAIEWTGRIMALHARSQDAREGMAPFLEKRRSEWNCGERGRWISTRTSITFLYGEHLGDIGVRAQALVDGAFYSELM